MLGYALFDLELFLLMETMIYATNLEQNTDGTPS